MQFKKLAFFTILSLLIFTGCDSKNSNNNENSIEIIENPSFTLKTATGLSIEVESFNNGFKIKGYENRVVLLNFFATWCPPCKAEIPHLLKLRKKFKGEFEIFAILVSDKKTNLELEAFKKEFNINYPVLNGSANDELAQYLGGVRTIPTMFMLRRDGSIMEKYVGMVPEEMLESDIRRAMK